MCASDAFAKGEGGLVPRIILRTGSYHMYYMYYMYFMYYSPRIILRIILRMGSYYVYYVYYMYYVYYSPQIIPRMRIILRMGSYNVHSSPRAPDGAFLVRGGETKEKFVAARRQFSWGGVARGWRAGAGRGRGRVEGGGGAAQGRRAPRSPRSPPRRGAKAFDPRKPDPRAR